MIQQAPHAPPAILRSCLIPLKSVVDMLFRDHGIRDGKPLPMRADEEGKRFPRDDVYQRYLFCYERMEFNRAVNELRGHYHPSMLDRPEDVLFARVEFNMQVSSKVLVHTVLESLKHLLELQGF